MLDLLPVEIVEYIFGYISRLKDIHNLSLTCKLFNQIIFRSIVCLDGVQTISISTVKHFPSLKMIDAPVLANNDKDLNYITSRKFSRLCLYFTHPPRIMSYNIGTFLGQNPQLKQFNITYREYEEFQWYRHVSLCRGVLHTRDTSCTYIDNPYINHIEFSGVPTEYIGSNPKLTIIMSDVDMFDNRTYKDGFNQWISRHNIPWNVKFNTLRTEYPDCDHYGDVIISCRCIWYIEHACSIQPFKQLIMWLIYTYPNSNFDNVVYNQTKIDDEMRKEEQRIASQTVDKWHNGSYNIKCHNDAVIEHTRKRQKYNWDRAFESELQHEIRIDKVINGVRIQRSFKII